MLEAIDKIVSLTLLVMWIPCLFMNLKRDLMMFQQNSYRPDRYARWAKTSGESTTITRCAYLFATFFLAVSSFPVLASGTVAGIILLWNLIVQISKKYKKPLVFTRRAVRLMVASMLIAMAVAVIVTALFGLRWGCVAAMALMFISQLVLLVANFILKPVESHITRRYYNEAAEMLRSMPELKVVGITGSYGKTSTKHYLHRILSEQFDTLMTPGSFNTTLGVVRTVREQLKPYNEVFIVEMGAKQPGDIREICDLVHPSMGIITAVGEQHLESFKSIENVQRTKFELADSLPADGLVVLNDDFPYIANRTVDNTRVARYAVDNVASADFHAVDIDYSPQGTSFTIVTPDGEHMRLTTSLVGQCNISNLMAAVIVALNLGVDKEKIRYAVEQIEQVEHRLNLKHTPGGITIIDDAFNSNPDGSAMALDVLKRMTGGQRIVITPGMIELGERQFELNRAFGTRIGQSVDVAIVVGRYNREAIVEGIEESGFPKDKIYAVDSFADAQQRLSAIAKPGDTVLYENDLPDTFK